MVEPSRANLAPAERQSETATGDMLYGVKAIAAYLGIKARQAQYLVETKRAPTFRIGGTICGRRSTLTAWLAEQEAKSAAPNPPSPAQP